jgi:hypothetical protein
MLSWARARSFPHSVSGSMSHEIPGSPAIGCTLRDFADRLPDTAPMQGVAAEVSAQPGLELFNPSEFAQQEQVTRRVRR